MNIDDIDEKELDNWFLELNIKKKIKQNRFEKFEKWLENNSFDKLIERLVDEHIDKYNINNKLTFLFNYVDDRYDEIKDKTIEEEYFPTKIKFFKGYYFVTIYGQGSISRIYKDKKLILNI